MFFVDFNGDAFAIVPNWDGTILNVDIYRSSSKTFSSDKVIIGIESK